LNSPQIPRTSKTIKRLWLAGTALAAFVLTVAIGNCALPEDKRLTTKMLGHDFLAFYTAGSFLNQNRSHDLYDLDKVAAFQHDLAARENLEIGESFGPFWNPPFYAWVFAPLAKLPYRQALATWWTINGIALLGAIALLIRVLKIGRTTKHEDMKHEEGGISDSPLHSKPATRNSQLSSPLATLLLIPLLLCVSMPFIQAFSHGQNTMISLALLAGVITLWRSGHPIFTGLVAGLLLYKPQLGAVVAAAVVITMGWRALIGLAITGSALAFVTLFTLPGVLSDYQRLLPANLHLFQVEHLYLWDRHVTLRAFWRMLFQGREIGETATGAKICWFISIALLALGLTRAWWAARRSGSTAARDGLIAATIIAMPLVMPFYFDYDLLLLAAPATLCAGIALRSTQPYPRAIFWTWVTLFAYLIVNSPIARTTSISGTVLLLATLETLIIRQILVDARHARLPKPITTPTPGNAPSQTKLATAA